MDLDKKVRISADASQLESTFDRIKRDAAELATGMMQDAEKRVSSSRELVKSLNDEIKLMERRNSLDVAERKSGLQERIDRNPHDNNAKKELSNIGIEEKEAKIQNELLKDILEELKGGKVKELDEKERLEKETVANERHEQRVGELDVREQDRAASGFRNRVRGYGMSVIGARNGVDAGLNIAGETGGLMASAEGAVGATGVALLIAAAIGKQIVSAATPYLQGKGDIYAVTGQRLPTNIPNYNQYGYNETQYLNTVPGLSKARRSSVGIYKSAEDQMKFKRGMGLDESTYSDFDRMALLEGTTGANQLQQSIAGLRSGGVVRGGDMSSASEYLGIIANLGKEQVSRLARIDQGMNTRVVASLASMNDFLQRSPEALSSLVSGLQSGLTHASSPQQESVTMAILSKIHPEMSLWDLKKEEARGLTPERLKGEMQWAKQVGSGNKNSERWNLQSRFPALSGQQIDELIDGSPKLIKSLQDKSLMTGKGVDVDIRGQEATGGMTSAGAKFSQFWIDFVKAGEKAMSAAQKHYLEDPNPIGGKQRQSEERALSKAADSMNKVADSLNNAIGKPDSKIIKKKNQ